MQPHKIVAVAQQDDTVTVTTTDGTVTFDRGDVVDVVQDAIGVELILDDGSLITVDNYGFEETTSLTFDRGADGDVCALQDLVRAVAHAVPGDEI